MSDPIGRLVAEKYRIRRKLGKGGFGAVYEAEHLEIQKRVAIKTIDKAHAAVPERVARFKREARIAGSVESEHIVHVFDTGEDEELGLYMVMELLQGEDLATRLVRQGRIPPEEAVHLAWQAARGLAKAHAAGVVHRDLKPANLYLCKKDDRRGGDVLVKVVDFGVSKLLGDKEQITRAGMTMGTPQYMAPEQVRGGQIDARADVWALGAVLYEMLAGRPAYPLLESYEMTFMSIATSRPRPLALVAPDVPAPLVSVVEKCLQHDAERRYANAGALSDALVDAFPHVFPDAVRKKSSGSLEVAGVPKRGFLRPIVIGAIVLLVGVAVAGFALRKKETPPPSTTTEDTTSASASESAATTVTTTASATTTTESAQPTTTATPSETESAPAATKSAPTTKPTKGVTTKPTTTATTKTTETPFGATGVSTQY